MGWCGESAELPLAAGGSGDQLALTTASLPAPLQVQALPKEICADAGLSRSLLDTQWPRPLPCPSHLSCHLPLSPSPTRGHLCWAQQPHLWWEAYTT